MPARDAAAAVAGLRGELQRTLSYLTTAVLQFQPYRSPGVVHAAALNAGNAVTIGADLLLGVRLHFRVTELGRRAWEAAIVAYYYELLDGQEREILAFHWHPEGRSPVIWPHLHLGPGLGDLTRPAATAHIPTGLVPLTYVVWLALAHFGARSQRTGWETRLLLG